MVYTFFYVINTRLDIHFSIIRGVRSLMYISISLIKYILYYIMKYLFIDIRKSDEVYSKRFAYSEKYSVYNIPMNMIRFNDRQIVKHLEYVDVI